MLILFGERLRGGVDGRDAAHEPEPSWPLQVLDQPEVGDLDAVGDQEQVARLDVEVLQVVLLDQVVEALGRVGEVAEQDRRGGCPAGRPAWYSEQQSCRFLSASSMTMTSSPSTILDLVHRQDERVADLP